MKKEIDKTYFKNKKKIYVIKDFSYSFYTNTFYCIKGRSGVGKTTLINILGLIKQPTSGTYFIYGKDVRNFSDVQRASLRNRGIGFIFQDFKLLKDRDVFENVAFAQRVIEKPNRIIKKRVPEILTLVGLAENIMVPLMVDSKSSLEEVKSKAFDLLKLVGLEEKSKFYPKELSGGEKQRVAIARALVNNPTLILADEPTTSLDEENESIILNLLKKLSKKGKCVIVVSHDSVVEKYADEILKL